MDTNRHRAKLLSRKDKTMTVTRKDLNEIANTFNQRIKLHLIQKQLDKAKAVWFTAEEMFHTMVRLNPNVTYEKWCKVVCKDFKYEDIFYEGRAMTNQECLDTAMALIDAGHEMETVSMNDLNSLDETCPITKYDWKVVLEKMKTLWTQIDVYENNCNK
jgi:hypothetical protein